MVLIPICNCGELWTLFFWLQSPVGSSSGLEGFPGTHHCLVSTLAVWTGSASGGDQILLIKQQHWQLSVLSPCEIQLPLVWEEEQLEEE